MPSSPMMQNQRLTGFGMSLLFAGIATLLLYYGFRTGRPDPAATKLLKSLAVPAHDKDDEDGDTEDDDDNDNVTIEQSSTTSTSGKETDDEIASLTPKRKNHLHGSEDTPNVSNRSGKTSTKKKRGVGADGSNASSTRETFIAGLHQQIEILDRKGKKLFKEHKHLDAAEVFTEALDLISTSVADDAEGLGASLDRQTLTLTNNRSAMYEKAKMPDLALHDCDSILELDPMHTKARTRKLRILESLCRYTEALVEVCALQLKFVQDNREKLRMGIPVTPPVQQSKIEELMGHILPTEIEGQLERIRQRFGVDEDPLRPLPSHHTILQLLQSFTGYNGWMRIAAEDGGLDVLTEELEGLGDDEGKGSSDKVKRAELLLRRGRRFAYHRKFDSCSEDFETAFLILEEDDEVKDLLERETYARILEWVGTCRHLRYDLEGAAKCYGLCADLEPNNSEILVKRAGVCMDGGKLEEGLALFDSALELDPNAVDALLHRANLRMIQTKPTEAKADLDRCIELCPDHILAWLRLATVLMSTDDMDGARRCLEKAQEIDPQSSEVHSYRGEMLFQVQDFVSARVEFDLAIECDSKNPTPYVNAALAVMNTPVDNGPPDIAQSIGLLEKAIEIDPQYQTAYIHLGQLKLSMATDLSTAKEVVELYDKGLSYCRTSDELKDIVSMRILTVAQVDAAGMLKMDTLNMQ